ncbi:hypothetical protein RND71_008348 [Anisodus tanguticus]|uniref:Uncharacterized protein n=1 Tax=Anisodus tanguticus TaxID=243964 RepID=A0AAE1SNI3_9SOLA|nr:hypothetical protein RND71_008348 [Anisodus tanguticus]
MLTNEEGGGGGGLVEPAVADELKKMGVDGIKAYGIEKLIQLVASQLSDQLPKSRKAARALLKTLK